MNQKTTDEDKKIKREKFMQSGYIENRFPDGGWGWIVAVACLITRACKQLIPTSFGILFSGVLLELGASSSTTAWIYNIYVILEQFSKCLVSPLGDVVGWRVVVMASGLMCSLSTIALMSVTSVAYFIAFFSIGLGLSCGLASSTSNIIIAYYFDKNRGKAMALTLTGIFIGQFCSSLLITFLLEQYGYKGAILIISAIMLHIFAAGSVMHPVEWHLKRSSTKIGSLGHNLLPKNGPIISREHDHNSPAIFSYISKGSQKFMISTIEVLRALVDNFKSLRSYRAIIFSLSISSYISGYLNFHMMIPFKMQSSGYSFNSAVICISTMALFGGFSRIVAPILSDWNRFNTKLVYIIGLAGQSISLLGFTLVTSLREMVVFSSFIGLFNGVTISLYTLVMINELGMKLFKAAYGASGILVGLSAITLGPLVGMARDVSGDYDLSMRLSAGGVIMSFIFMLLLPVATAFEKTGVKSQPKKISSIEKA